MAPKLELRPGKYKWLDRGIFARGSHDGIVYGISYSYHGRRRLEVVGPTITMARQALAIRKAEIAQGRFNIESTRRLVRFPAFVEQYLATHSRPNKRSSRRDEWASAHMVAFFGERRIDQITSWEIERYRAKRVADGVSVATINRELALLKHMLGRAVIRGDLRINPALAVKLGKEPERPFRILSEEEEDLLVARADPDFVPLLIVALRTGLRRGELLGLEWRDVDLIREQITVRQSKSGRVRYVPLEADSIAALRSIQRIAPDVHVFWNYVGVDGSKANRHLATAVRRSSIVPLRFHDLRHTYASRLVAAGLDLPAVQELLGHSTIVMTRRYSHPTPKHKREGVARLTRGAAKVQPLSTDGGSGDRSS